jgi:PAS domain S-box-containing protein
MFCVAGFDGYFKQVNPAWEATLGWTIADLLARPYIEFIHPDDRPSTQAAAQQVEAGRPLLTFENRYRRKDGSYRWFQWNATPFEEQQLIYATARDITEHRLLEDQLRQSQKIEAVGQLAGGIAHDFNNILFIIQGYAESLKAGLPDDSAEHEAANQIESATNRAASLTQQLLAFGRKQVIRPSVLSLNNIVVATSTMLTRVIGEDIVMTTALTPCWG